MSSNNNAKEVVDEVTMGQVVPGEVPEGEQLDVSMLYSSDHEESEQGPKADEALQDESGNGAESAKLDEVMEVSDDIPKVGADNVKPSEEMEDTGNTHQVVGIKPTKEDEDMTLQESNEVKDGKDDGDHNGDLDQYLDVLMLDSTMSVAKAMKGGDVVLMVPCPHMDHKVNLKEVSGFFYD